jgi:hypothetical protein
MQEYKDVFMFPCHLMRHGNSLTPINRERLHHLTPINRECLNHLIQINRVNV